MKAGVRVLGGAAAGLVAVLAGCASSEPARRPLTAADFSDKGPGGATAPAPAEPVKPIPTRTKPVSIAVKPEGPRVAPAPVEEVRPSEVAAEPGPPALAPNAAAAAETVLIDAKIGDVNNRAFYAASFLESMEAKLRADAVDLMRDLKGDEPRVRAAWDRLAREQIGGKMMGLIKDEIFRAEGLATLKPEQKQGLQAYLGRIRDEEIRKNQGSLTLTEEEISRKTGGKALDEYMRDREQLILVQHQLYEQIDRKIQIAWRDIKAQYERDYDVYHADPTVFFRVIMVDGKNEAAVKAVGEALASGQDFAEVASRPENAYLRKEGGLRSLPVKGEFEAMTFVAAEPVNAALRRLKPGETAGPIDAGGQTAWVKLENIIRTDIDLYDAQLRIENSIFDGRRQRAIESYVAKLQERASLSDLEEMVNRILQYARERVLDPVIKAGVPAAPSGM